MQKYLLALLSIIWAPSYAAMAPTPKFSRNKDPYVPMLAFLDAFIAGNNRITSSKDNVVHFPSLVEPERVFTFHTKQVVSWLESAYKEPVTPSQEADYYERVRQRQKLLGIPLFEATEQAIMNLPNEEKIRIQINRSRFFTLLFSHEQTLKDAVAKEVARMNTVTDEARIRASIILCTAESCDPLNDLTAQYLQAVRRHRTIAPLVCSRLALLQALRSGNSNAINQAADRSVNVSEFFPPLQELLAREIPEMAKAYALRAELEDKKS